MFFQRSLVLMTASGCGIAYDLNNIEKENAGEFDTSSAQYDTGANIDMETEIDEEPEDSAEEEIAEPQEACLQNGFTEIATIPLEGYFAEPSSIANADFDNDGDIDMVMALTEQVSVPGTQEGKFAYFENDGTESFSESDSHFIPTYHYDLSVCDVNLDGFLDVISTTSANVYIFTNDQVGGFTLSQTIPMNLYGAIVCTDINDDTMPDIIGGTQTGHGAQIAVLTQRQSGSFQVYWNSPIIGSDYDSIHDLEIFDFNNDGLLDIFSSELYGGVAEVYLNTGYTFSKSYTKIFPSRIFGIEAADINHDDNIDIIASWGNSGATEILVNDGTGSSFDSFWEEASISGAVFNIHASDFDNDGNLDLYQGGFNGFTRVQLGDGSGTFTPFWEHTLDEGSGYVGHAVDITQDGCVDIVAGELGIVRIFEND